MTERRPYSGPERQGVAADPIDSCPGFFKLRLVKGGAEIAARLFKIEERDEETGDLLSDVRYFAEIDGESVDPLNPPRWPWTPISEADYRYLIDDAAHCRKYKPDAPRANPYIPMNLAPAEYI